jgi:hypothetical protein
MAAGTIDLSRASLVLSTTGQIPPSGADTFLTGTFPEVVESVSTMSDGQAVRRVRQPGAMDFTITCGKHSEAHRLLGTKWDRETAQRAGRLKIEGEALIATDPTSGTVFAAAEVVIKQPPALSMDSSAEVTWVLTGTKINAVYGRLIPVGGGAA